MSVSKLLPSSGNNDFNIAISGTNTKVTFEKEYAAGAYTITATGSDTSYDIYAYSGSGTFAGYTNSASFTASIPFNKMVIIGQTNGTLLSFTYKKTYTTISETDEVTAGPVILSLSTSTLANINDTTTITGLNFATDVTVTFTSANTAYPATAAKSVVRNSATSLTITRPDNLITTYNPYTITLQNPGITNPTGSNSHILSNGVSAGNAPVWQTASLISYTTNAATSVTLSATDADGGSTVSYSIVSGTLPSGLSLNGTTGVISGTPTTSQITVTFRATDTGGNYVDKAIKFNAVPVWSTAAGARPAGISGVSYSSSVVATDDTAGLTYAIASGALPNGLSLNTSTGAITGTPTTTGSNTFGINVTDSDGATTGARTFTIYIGSYTTLEWTGSTSWTAPSTITGSADLILVAGGGGGGSYGTNVGSGGGGAGGVLVTTATLTPSQTYTITIGGGGGGASGSGVVGGNGGNTTFAGFTAVGGGGGGGNNQGGNNGGSGGGAARGGGGAPTTDQGNYGGGDGGGGQWTGGGGGGKSSAGANSNSGAGGGGGSAYYTFNNVYVGGGGGGGGASGYGGGSGGTNAANGGSGNAGGSAVNGYGGGGGGGGTSSGGSGGSGRLIVRYVS